MAAREVLQRIKAATVAIARWHDDIDLRHPFSIIGSGFCIDPSGIVVTSRHVVDDFLGKPTLAQIKEPTGEKTASGAEVLPPIRFEDLYVVFYSMLSPTQLSVLLAHVTHVICKTDHDLALLRVNPEGRQAPYSFPVVQIAEPEEVNEGDDVGICGFPLGVHLRDALGTVTASFTKGIVSSVVPGPGIPRHLIRAFQLDAGAAPGNSGGPVFFWDSGRVFGALEAGLKPETQATHLTKATALHHLPDGDSIEALKQAKIGEYPSIKP
jgi:S1-C subfamily serine protease